MVYFNFPQIDGLMHILAIQLLFKISSTRQKFHVFPSQANDAESTVTTSVSYSKISRISRSINEENLINRLFFIIPEAILMEGCMFPGTAPSFDHWLWVNDVT